MTNFITIPRKLTTVLFPLTKCKNPNYLYQDKINVSPHTQDKITQNITNILPILNTSVIYQNDQGKGDLHATKEWFRNMEWKLTLI